MRTKRTISILAIIIGSLFLVIAYAAIASQTLKIMGSASATTSDANFDVKFVSYDAYSIDYTDESITPTVTIDETGKNATIDVSGLDKDGDGVHFIMTIKNTSPADIAALVTPSVTNSNNEWFTVTSFWAIEDFYEGTSILIEPGETTNVGIGVFLKRTPVTDADVEAAKTTINVTINAQPQ